MARSSMGGQMLSFPDGLRDRQKRLRGHHSPGIFRARCPIEHLLGGRLGICMVSAGHFEKQNTDQYRIDADIVADRGAQLPRAAERAGCLRRSVAFGSEARLAEQPLQREFLLRSLWRFGELRQLCEAGRQVADRLQIGRASCRVLAGPEPIVTAGPGTPASL